MSERRERIPAEEVPDPKRWKLPYWTEPQHVIHVDEEEEDDSDVLVEEEEIEVEPLTADQLEAIRQEAYNEGLEQGLIEGRQKGEKQGHDAGHAEGLVSGKEEGKKIGYEEGLAKGEKAALAEGEDKSAQLTSRIQSNMRHIEKSINEQRSSLEKILPELVISLSEAVVSEELSQGSEHIVQLVHQALDALPTDTQGLTIECNSLDLPYLEAAQENSDFEAKFKTSEGIQPGGCKVKSQFSSIDFTLSERWQSLVSQYHQQLQLGFNNLEEIQKSHAEEVALESSAQESAEKEHAQKEHAQEEHAQEENAETLDKNDSLINEIPTNENDEIDVQAAEENTASSEVLNAQQEPSEQENENQSTEDNVAESKSETPGENSELVASQEIKEDVESIEEVETDQALNSDSSVEANNEIDNQGSNLDDDSILEADSQESAQLDESQVKQEDDSDSDQNDPLVPDDADE